MIIALLGYMGSGKSSIGVLLAEELNVSFNDLDAFIEEQERKSIPEIFTEHGEIYFRKKEHDYLKKYIESNASGVLALGGGTPCYANNMELLLNKEQVITVYLKASLQTLLKRLATETNSRPLLKNIPVKDLPEFIAKHVFERTPFYNKADFTVIVDGKSKTEIVNEIMALL